MLWLNCFCDFPNNCVDRQGLYFVTLDVQHLASAQWGSFLQVCGPAAHYSFHELVMIFCCIPLHSPRSAKLISVSIKHPKRSREIICISADKSLCLMEASSYRKSCDSQAKLLWLMPLSYFFIFFLRLHWREKNNCLSAIFIYSRNILQVCPLSAHAELFCRPVYWQSKSHTNSTESQIWNNVLLHFYPLKSTFSESFLLSEVTEIKNIPVAVSFHF